MDALLLSDPQLSVHWKSGLNGYVHQMQARLSVTACCSLLCLAVSLFAVAWSVYQVILSPFVSLFIFSSCTSSASIPIYNVSLQSFLVYCRFPAHFLWFMSLLYRAKMGGSEGEMRRGEGRWAGAEIHSTSFMFMFYFVLYSYSVLYI